MPDRLAVEEEAGCTRCGLSATRTHVVVGRGSRSAGVMFVGEAPGRQEDQSGLGFQGAAGQRFNDMLAFVGLTREDIWLANAVRCRPSIEGRRNRPPTRDEIAACRHWLIKNVERIAPRVVVTLGRVAFESVSGLPWDGALRAAPIKAVDLRCEVFPLYHPAYLIYRRELYETYRNDLLGLRMVLSSRGVPLLEPAGPWK